MEPTGHLSVRTYIDGELTLWTGADRLSWPRRSDLLAENTDGGVSIMRVGSLTS